jgi:CRISPR-associated endonuclease Cas2
MKKQIKPKKQSLGFVEKMQKLYKAGLEGSPPPNRQTTIDPDLPTLTERVEQLMGLLKRNQQKAGTMIYFVMYDIESNKVRTQIVKYLIKKGCTRVQKSIFIASTDRIIFDEIQSDLKEVQACYDNNDSILLIPVSTDEIRAMKLIGSNIDFDLALKNRNTLFF